MDSIREQLDLSKLKSDLVPLLYRFRYPLISTLIIGVFLFTIIRINELTSYEVDEAKRQEGISQIKKVKFDEEAIKKIEELNDLNVDVKPAFPTGRNNPFE